MDFNLRKKVKEAYSELLKIERKEQEEENNTPISITLTKKEWKEIYSNLERNCRSSMGGGNLYTIINKLSGKF